MRGLRSSVIAHLRRPWSWAAAPVVVALAGGVLSAAPAVDPADCVARLEAAVEAISTYARVKDVPRAKLKGTLDRLAAGGLRVASGSSPCSL